ncbi:lytic murein transglycosylase [Patescibacteria group bacterium]
MISIITAACAAVLGAHLVYSLRKRYLRLAFAAFVLCLAFVVISGISYRTFLHGMEAIDAYQQYQLDKKTPARTVIPEPEKPTEKPAKKPKSQPKKKVVSDDERLYYTTIRDLKQPTRDQIFKSASRKFGVPEDILKALFKQETDEGKKLGKHLAVIELANAPGHLRSLRKICHENGLDINQVKSSSSGAIGLTQFKPTWWLHYAVDGNHDGKRNPFELADAIHSTANYVSILQKKHGTLWWALHYYGEGENYAWHICHKAEKISGKPGKYMPS